jgi:hypothetical protein
MSGYIQKSIQVLDQVFMHARLDLCSSFTFPIRSTLPRIIIYVCTYINLTMKTGETRCIAAVMDVIDCQLDVLDGILSIPESS